MESSGLTLGSLFDGSGGFPLGGVIAGITPIWSAEIEPFPVKVTEKRMPSVLQLGDISKINGADIPKVDIISFGSPCQDLSIAGKRNGLEGSRSGLFYEAIRIIREMRCATNGEYPRYAVWENVKGAFSSNNGDDFRAVLEEFCKVKDENITVPRCDKWKSAGCILGESFSVAWRLFDAQFWGVPQRRERIYAVADFTGKSAGDILFNSEGLSGYSAESFRAWQSAANGTEGRSGETGAYCLNDQGGSVMNVSEDVTGTLRAESHGHEPLVASAGFCTEHSADARGIGYQEETAPTLRAGTVPAAMMFENHSQDSRYKGPLEVSQTVSATFGMGGNNQPFVVQPPMTLKIRSGCEGGGKGALIQEDKSATLGTHNDQTLFQPRAFGVCSKTSHSMLSDNPNSGFYEADTSRCLDANGGNPTCNQGGIAVVEGNGTRPSHKGDGYSESDVMYTLNATEQHAVAYKEVVGTLCAGDGPGGVHSHMADEGKLVLEPSYGLDRASYNMGQNAQFGMVIENEVEPTIVAKGPGAVAHPVYSTSKASYHMEAEENIANTLVATDYKDPPTVTEEPYYIVRRLTPVECARLQGFPDWWCDDLASEEPTDEEVAKWMDIFETHRKALGRDTKPKTANQIRKWLKDPYSDSAAYKMWGNGVALPNVYFVLSGIVYYAQIPDYLL